MTFHNTKKNPLFVFLGAVVISIVVFSFIKFERDIRRNVSDNSTNFLKETAFLYAGTFQVKLNDQLFMLESQARYFQDIDMNDYNMVKQTIMSTKGVGEFKRIAVANTSGMTVNYDGQSSGNILMKDYFKKAIRGKAQISSKISVDEDGEEVLTLAVPIFQKGHIVGVITGTFSYTVLDNIFSVDTFGGEGYSIISDKEGTILIGTENPKRLCFVDNWFNFFKDNKAIPVSELSAIYSDIQSNRTGVFDYAVNNEKRIVVYTPVGVNDWYVLSSVTADFILSQEFKITKITTKLLFVLIVAFSLIACFISYLVIQKSKIERDNARYAVNSENSQTIIFEYDFDHKNIEFTGSTEYIFGANIRYVNLSEFSLIQNKIHESERGLLDDLKKFVASGENKYSSEFRLANTTGDYAWHRISGTLIFDKENKPIKFIGNIVNVNAQVVHEQELKTLAETDLLSGLINKVYMEKSVSDFVKENKNSALGAFYMIDLDNFKQVNDKLGHSFGDQAICDTANKLSLVFSEKDFIGRIGGDEFCVFLCLKNNVKNYQEVVEEKARTLKSIIAEYYSNGEESVQITPSIGISLFPSQGVNYKELFKKADVALYHVKNSGKNNYAIFDSNMKNAGESVYE